MKTKIIIPRRENAAKMRKVRVFFITMLMCVFADTARHGSFDGSVVRVKGDPVLKRRASEVTAEDLACQNDDGKMFGECGSEAERIVKKMIQGVKETFGSCIAAPQVGESKRIILMSLPEERLKEEDEHGNQVSPPSIFVNPELLGIGNEKIPVWEGCLSVPGTYVVVERFSSVRYRAQRLDGAYIEGIATGRLALTLQHEVDHLNGILMTDINTTESGHFSIRSDARGAVTSTSHWDMMNTIPDYDLQTYTFPGAIVTNQQTRKIDL